MLGLLALLIAPGQAAAMQDPIVIAHRGASGLRPEHTIASYTLAIEQGADFIEPDLVPTKDGVLVARHENEISETTDVAVRPEFAGRRTTKTIDGAQVSGWFTEDFTLAELKTLRAKERLPLLRGTDHDGLYEVPTFAEVVALARKHGVGVYPETKHPSYFVSIGLETDTPLLAELKKVGWDRADAPVFIQSFEVDNLKRLKGRTAVRLIQLMDAKGAPSDGAVSSYAAMTTPEGLKAVAAYAYGIGPAKAMIRDGEAVPTSLVADAHAAGLKVHPWTFRAENAFLPASLRSGLDPRAHGRLDEEIARYLELGVDGFFTDFPLDGVHARDARRRAR
ncbi:glycerophosphodiester phosphodiesterase [Sphingomonas sp.]|uniref:glycerophosphodiester phosphodiesterase n=1 Tax=Sphingomonas sp. TaxID=28214 RepID=UPI002DD6B4BC|nr:glycerophosphodiester phosphodiesterase [Sphingomonas sp.]